MNKRVVITGMGALTPIGNNVKAFWENIKKGIVGIQEITHFDTSEYKVKLAAELKGFEATDFIDKKEAKRLDPFCQYAVVAAREAMAQSGLDMEKEDPYRIGCIVSTGVGGIETMEREQTKLLQKGPRRVSPLMVPMLICNMASGNVAIDLGLKGKCYSILSACATSTHSIGEAFRSIKYGESDAVITGGCEASITPLGIAGFASLQTLNETEDAKRASIPFDAERHGFVMGEGAGILVLEELEHAKARGANILAEVVGYGATCDAYHITSPSEDGSGAAKAMTFAMEEAGVTPSQIDYINAHGTSTKLNDLFETRAVKMAFGEEADKVAISSTKSMIGHLLGAAGAVELITCVKSLQDNYVHENAGLKVADPDCDLDYVKDHGREMEVNYVLSNNLGFGGHNASVVVKKYVE